MSIFILNKKTMVSGDMKLKISNINSIKVDFNKYFFHNKIFYLRLQVIFLAFDPTNK